MNEHFKRQTEQLMSAAKDARIPENVQAMALDGVARTREAFDALSVTAKDQARVAEELSLATQAGMKMIGNKLLENTMLNSEAVFDAAQSIARAGTLLDAMRIQGEFMQRQLAVASTQTKELLELSTSIATQSFEQANAAGTKVVEKAQRRRA